MSKARQLIAIVDDEDSVCRALKRLMLSAGLEVETFSTGVEFLKSLGSHRPDCLVLDLHMPGMSGFEVISQLTQAGHKLPVVTITGHDTPVTRQRALDAGASSYLCKPVDGTTLLDAVMAAIASGPSAGP